MNKYSTVINHMKTKQIGPQPRQGRSSITASFVMLLAIFFCSSSSWKYLSQTDFLSYISKYFEYNHASKHTEHNDIHSQEIMSVQSIETEYQQLDGRRDDFAEHGCIAAARAERKRKEENGLNYANDYLDIASLEVNSGQSTEAVWMARLKNAEIERMKS